MSSYQHSIVYVLRYIEILVEHRRFLANVNLRSRSLCYRRSVGLSVTFVRPTQPVEIFGNFSSPFGTLAIHCHPRKILRRLS